MKVKDVKAIARQWVIEIGIKTSDFFGAYLTGSINHFSDDAKFPVSSDVDIAIILSRPDPNKKPTKFLYRNVIIEVSYTPIEEIGSPEQVLGNYHRAGAFRTPNIISDPTGQLTKLQKAVARDFANRSWVRKRCEDAMNNTRRFLDAVNTAELYHDQVTCWLFGTAAMSRITDSRSTQPYRPTQVPRNPQAPWRLRPHGVARNPAGDARLCQLDAKAGRIPFGRTHQSIRLRQDDHPDAVSFRIRHQRRLDRRHLLQMSRDPAQRCASGHSTGVRRGVS